MNAGKLLLLLFLLPCVYAAQDVNVTVYEDGKITSYLNTYWVVQVSGNGTINNPSDQDLYDVRLYYDLLTLDILDDGGDGRFGDGYLFFDRIPAGSVQTFSYTIRGITTEPPTLTDKGVFYSALAKRSPRIYSDAFGELQKAPLEDASITGRPGRLISVTISNPTTLQFTVESMRVIKTPTRDPNQILATWDVVNESAPRVIDPDGFFVHDILDRDSAEGMVYWLQSEVYISRVNLADTNGLDRFTEVNLTVPIEELNFSNVSRNESSPYFRSTYTLRKKISDTVAVPGEPLEVLLVLYNFGDQLESFVMTDSLPAGFSADRDLVFQGDVSARSSVFFSYDVVLNDSSIAGFDAFPRAQAVIGGDTVYSPEVPFIRQFLPDERVYVQKEVRMLDADRASVTITVQNLGKSALSGAHLKEFLLDDDLFAEMTAVPESKGVWAVPGLAPGASWSVSYMTEQGDSLTRLPSLYGVATHTVLRSLVLENVVSEAWEFVRTNVVELFGVLLLLLVPLVYVVGRRQSWF